VWIGDLFNGIALIVAVALAANRRGKPLLRRRRRPGSSIVDADGGEDHVQDAAQVGREA
jgi:hypothetical protein